MAFEVEIRDLIVTEVDTNATVIAEPTVAGKAAVIHDILSIKDILRDAIELEIHRYLSQNIVSTNNNRVKLVR